MPRADIPECDSAPCDAAGTDQCIDLVLEYTCACNAGKTGVLCEIGTSRDRRQHLTRRAEINECSSSPCQYSDLAVDANGDRIADAQFDPLNTGGASSVCVDGDAGFRCECNEHTDGDLCENCAFESLLLLAFHCLAGGKKLC